MRSRLFSSSLAFDERGSDEDDIVSSLVIRRILIAWNRFFGLLFSCGRRKAPLTVSLVDAVDAGVVVMDAARPPEKAEAKHRAAKQEWIARIFFIRFFVFRFLVACTILFLAGVFSNCTYSVRFLAFVLLHAMQTAVFPLGSEAKQLIFFACHQKSQTNAEKQRLVSHPLTEEQNAMFFKAL